MHDVNDQLISECEYETMEPARVLAAHHGGPAAIICRIYAFDDSDLVWTSTGDTVWPPPDPKEKQ